MNIKGIILAGGRSSRFGSNKAIYEFQGRSMLKHSIDLLKYFCQEIVISGQKDEYSIYNYPSIPDKYGEIGPIGGIASCLEKFQKEECPVIIITCDMPLVTSDMISRLIENHNVGKISHFEDSHGNICPFPFIIEPFQIEKIVHLIQDKSLNLKNMFESCGHNSIRLLREEEACMANVNTQEDLILVSKVYEQIINQDELMRKHEKTTDNIQT